MSDTPQQFQDEERMDKPSASALQITVSCPGQLSLKKRLSADVLKIKEAAPDKDADRGTRIHKAFETDNALELNDEETETYQAGLKYERMIVENWAKDNNLKEWTEGPRELRIFLNDPNTLEPIASCKLDKHYCAGDKLLIIDFKSGWNPNLPASPKSWQLRFQAVALWQEKLDANITSIRVAHCKPKMSCAAEDVCDYSISDLQSSISSILFHLWEANQEDAPRHAGTWCNWCPCKSACPEAGAYAMLPSVIARKVQRSAEMPWDMIVQSMSTEDLVRIWESSTTITKIMDAVKDRLKKSAPEELARFGLGLGKGRKMPGITDTAAVFAFLMKTFPGKAKQILQCMEFSKTQIQVLVGSQFGMGKDESKRWVDNALKPWIVIEESAKPLERIK